MTTSDFELSAKTKAAVLRGFPDTGESWIQAFPQFLNHLLSRWSLTITGLATGGWPTNVVYFVEDESGAPLVLKVGHPSPESVTEGIVLQRSKFSSPYVKLLDEDPRGYALLMQRILPGAQLRESIRDDSAIAAALMLHKSLPQPAQQPELLTLPTYHGWMTKAFAEYREGDAPLDEFLGHIRAVEELFEALDPDDRCLLHGDLHHENILQSEDGWIAIDPKGVIGPAKMEVGRFLHNFMPDEIEGELTEAKFKSVLQRRFTLASEVLGWSEKSLAEITYIDLTLAVTWSLNSAHDTREAFAMLRGLRSLVQI